MEVFNPSTEHAADLSKYYREKTYVRKCIYLDEFEKINISNLIDFSCPICLNFIYDPKVCLYCNQLVGSHCLNAWLDDGNGSCPVSGCSLFCENKQVNINPVGKIKTYNDVVLPCKFSYCPQTLNGRTYYEHISKCEFRVFQCAADGCNFEGDVYEMREHIECLCEKTFKICDGCDKRFIYREYLAHRDQCDLPIICDICQRLIPSGAMRSHSCKKPELDVLLCHVCRVILEPGLNHMPEGYECGRNLIDKFHEIAHSNIIQLIKAEIEKINEFTEEKLSNIYYECVKNKIIVTEKGSVVDTNLHKGIMDLYDAKIDQAIVSLALSQKNNPNSVKADYCMAVCKIKKGLYQEAISLLKVIIRKDAHFFSFLIGNNAEYLKTFTDYNLDQIDLAFSITNKMESLKKANDAQFIVHFYAAFFDTFTPPFAKIKSDALINYVKKVKPLDTLDDILSYTRFSCNLNEKALLDSNPRTIEHKLAYDADLKGLAISKSGFKLNEILDSKKEKVPEKVEGESKRCIIF